MKKLSDYKNEDAIELWADLLDPFVEIVGDTKIKEMIRAKKPPLITAKEIVKTYKKQASEILLRIDPTPLDGLNIIVRLVSILNEIGSDPTMQSFFGLSAGGKEDETSFGPATENTEVTQNISSNM